MFEHYQEWQLELEREPVLFLARRLEGLLAEARAKLGDYVGADPDDLVFVPNATSGVNIAASRGSTCAETSVRATCPRLCRCRSASRGRSSRRSGPASTSARVCSTSATTRRGPR